MGLAQLGGGPSELSGSLWTGLGPVRDCGSVGNCSLTVGKAVYNASGYVASLHAPLHSRPIWPNVHPSCRHPLQTKLGPFEESVHGFAFDGLQPRRHYFLNFACNFTNHDDKSQILEQYFTVTTGTPIPAPSNLKAPFIS